MIKMFVESLKNLVSAPDTIKYPFALSSEPKRFRGTILLKSFVYFVISVKTYVIREQLNLR